jgi:hypothetical protein
MLIFVHTFLVFLIDIIRIPTVTDLGILVAAVLLAWGFDVLRVFRKKVSAK